MQSENKSRGQRELGDEITALEDEISRVAAVADQRVEATHRQAEAIQSIADTHDRKLVRLERRLLYGIVAALVLLTLVDFSGHGLFRVAPKECTEAERQAVLDATLSYYVEEIETFREETGKLPDSLEDLYQEEEEGLVFERLGGESYRVTVAHQGLTAHYETDLAARGSGTASKPRGGSR